MDIHVKLSRDPEKVRMVLAPARFHGLLDQALKYFKTIYHGRENVRCDCKYLSRRKIIDLPKSQWS